ncbi:hypothetical protein [Mesorhizobium sp.]|uniref:hypothetical protein n=1 Tax=Mesorhizobium sp. TaxID=1871066 RepID=UPI0025C18AC8|nr:hypothetical protein [Mesorhizobium sp.]
MESIFELLAAEQCTVEPCGSRVTCRPAPAYTDRDYLVEIYGHESAVSRIIDLLHSAGYRWEGSQHYQAVAASDFMSWRRDDINLIVTANPDFARRHRAATHVCKRLNLMVKADRIALFQAVLYGNIEKAPQAGFSREMQEALHADAEKLSAITGYEHRVEFFDADDELLV